MTIVDSGICPGATLWTPSDISGSLTEASVAIAAKVERAFAGWQRCVSTVEEVRWVTVARFSWRADNRSKSRDGTSLDSGIRPGATLWTPSGIAGSLTGASNALSLRKLMRVDSQR